MPIKPALLSVYLAAADKMISGTGFGYTVLCQFLSLCSLLLSYDITCLRIKTVEQKFHIKFPIFSTLLSSHFKKLMFSFRENVDFQGKVRKKIIVSIVGHHGRNTHWLVLCIIVTVPHCSWRQCRLLVFECCLWLPLCLSA